MTMFVGVFGLVTDSCIVVMLMMLVMCVRVAVNDGLVFVHENFDVLLRPEP
jgi:hypothetical protein